MSAGVKTGAAIVAAGGLALLAAACGGSPGSHVAQLGSTTTTSGANTSAAAAQANGAVAFSRCMRSHGVPAFPDPGSDGRIPKVSLQQLSVSNSQFGSAQSACRRLIPSGGPGPPTAAELRHAWSETRSFAQCMRSRGVRNWPDPTGDSVHPERPAFDLQPAGIDPSSPLITSKIHECDPLLHGWSPYVNTAAGQSHLAGT